MIGSTINFKSADGGTSFIINDQTSINAAWKTGVPYYISVETVDGLFGADMSVESHEIPNDIGEKSGDIFRRGKTITLSGNINGRDLAGVGAGSEFLEHMFWETSERHLIWTPLGLTTQVYYKCRINQDLSISVLKPQDWTYIWPWTVAVRADLPILYKVSDDTPFRSWES